ncbi:MAG TPA: hypothetical protein VMH81_20065 [Bryobacteraceae bacterium]|nr:hypothetical protein [Bryobacteraceae bacterium]
MRSRRFACLLLGMWIAAGILMQWIAGENYAAVDRILDLPNPSASLQFKALGPTASRQLLRYEAAEQNRFYFECWETAQLILGTFFFFFLLFGTRENKFCLLAALLMVVGVGVQRFFLTPEINALGRMLDFVPQDVYIAGRRRLPVAQDAYEALEAAKLVLAAILAVWLLMGRGRARRSRTEVRQELDLINKANYGHVDR